MQKISFKDRFGLTDLVLSGQKTQTRRIVPKEVFTFDWDIRENYENGTLELVIADSFGSYHNVIDTIYNKYKNNEVVAVAQNYEKAGVDFVPFKKGCKKWGDARKLAGWTNKMFVRADLMPHAIKITNVRIERLQDISDEDCLAEGVEKDLAEGLALYWFPVHIEGISWEEWKARSYELSRHEYEGKPGEYFWGTPQEAYAALIDKVNGKGTWESNPYVWAYDFELVK